MKSAVKKITMILLLLTLLIGCSKGEVISKTVADKKYIPAHSETSLNVTLYILLDIPIMESEWVEEEYKVILVVVKDKRGKIKSSTKSVTVTKEVYDSVEIGDEWNE